MNMELKIHDNIASDVTCPSNSLEIALFVQYL